MSTTVSELLAVPLEDLREAQIRIAFGGGELALGAAAPGMLVSGTGEGGIVHRFTGPGTLQLEPAQPLRWLATWRPLRWAIGVTAEIPVRLTLETGGNRSTIDLAALRVPRLELHTGASETIVRLPAGGRGDVRVECGFASVTLQVQPDVAARIRSTMAFGSTSVDESRFPRAADGWASPDFDTAANRVDLVIEGGFGSVQVR
jgi:hypothetical protein